MNDDVTTQVPPAWYPDPEQPSRLRWWDGLAWTTSVQDVPPPPVASVVHPQSVAYGVPATSVQPAEVLTDPVLTSGEIADPFVLRVDAPELPPSSREPLQFSHPSTSQLPDRVIAEARRRAARGEYRLATPGKPRSDARPAVERDANDDVDKDEFVGSATTVETWVMAILPIVGLIVVVIISQLPKAPHSSVVGLVIASALLFVSVLLASADRSTLRSRNHTRFAPTILGVVPPLYLFARTARVGVSSALPLIAWILLSGLVYGAISQVPDFQWVFSSVDVPR